MIRIMLHLGLFHSDSGLCHIEFSVVSDYDTRGYVVRNYVYGILSLYTIHLQCIKNNFSVQVAPSRAGHTRQLLRQSDNRFEAKTNVSSPITTKYCV